MMIALVNRFGSQTTAAYGAAAQLWNYMQMPALAIGMAASSMAAQNVGAGTGTACAASRGAGVLFNCPDDRARWSSRSICSIAPRWRCSCPTTARRSPSRSTSTRSSVWSFVLFGVSMVLGGVVRATGAVVPPLVVLFVSLWVVRIPFALALLDRYGADAIWWSFPVGAGVSAILMWLYYRYGGWKRAHMLPAATARAASR